jgi:cyclopropane fatty-acyl-phospholipid synthase-like methyltransferase
MSSTSTPLAAHALAWFLLACSGTPAPTAASPDDGRQAAHEHGSHAGKSHEHGLHKDFSNAEEFSAHFDDPARDAWQRPDELLDSMQIAPGSTVVDLGAGTGYFAAGLARRVGDEGQVLALDVEPKMIEFLERRVREQKLTNVSPKLVPSDSPGLAPGSVSRVLIVNTWHHIDQRPAYAKKLAESLAPGGQIWIVDFTLESDLGPPAEYRLPPEQVVRELTQAGLHAQVVEPEPLPKQYVVRAIR